MVLFDSIDQAKRLVKSYYRKWGIEYNEEYEITEDYDSIDITWNGNPVKKFVIVEVRDFTAAVAIEFLRTE